MINIRRELNAIKNGSFDISNLINQYKNNFENANKYLLEPEKHSGSFQPPILEGETILLLTKMNYDKKVFTKLNNGKLPQVLEKLYNLDGIYENNNGNTFLLFDRINSDNIESLNPKIKKEFQSFGLKAETLKFFFSISKKFNVSCVLTEKIIKANFLDYMKEYNLNEIKNITEDIARIGYMNICHKDVDFTFSTTNKGLEFNLETFENINQAIYLNIINHESAHLIYSSHNKTQTNISNDKHLNKIIEESFCDAYALLKGLRDLSKQKTSKENKTNFKNILIDYTTKKRDNIELTKCVVNEEQLDKHFSHMKKSIHLVYNNSAVLAKVLKSIDINKFKKISNNDLFDLATQVSLLYSNNEKTIDLANKSLSNDSDQDKGYIRIKEYFQEKGVDITDEELFLKSTLEVSKEIRGFLEKKKMSVNNDISKDYNKKVKMLRNKTISVFKNKGR